MKPIEVSAHVPLGLQAAWDHMFADELRQLAAASKMVAAIEDYELRPDGTPRYAMVMKAGPLRIRSVSDYSVYEKPRRTTNRIIGGLFDGGTCFIDFRQDGDGTRVDMRIDVAPRNRLSRAAFAVMRPLLAVALTTDLRAWAAAAKPARAGSR